MCVRIPFISKSTMTCRFFSHLQTSPDAGQVSAPTLCSLPCLPCQPSPLDRNKLDTVLPDRDRRVFLLSQVHKKLILPPSNPPLALCRSDQAFHIAHNVGSAFSDLTLQEETSGPDLYDAESAEDSKAEALIKDCFLSDPSYQRNRPQQRLRISAEDQEFLEDLSPPTQIPSMRCPTIEGTNSTDHPKRNSIPSDEGHLPSSAQHQIQLLKYQLEQQAQQTRIANHQVELLTDQVGAESAARLKAQEQNNQLMIQNQELLNHIERLFQQVEELEKQIRVYERASKIPHLQEPQTTQFRTRPAYTGTRRLSGDSTSDKPTLPDNSNFTPRRGSFASSKANPPQHKTGNLATPKLSISPPQQNRQRTPLANPKPYIPSIQQNRQQPNDSKGLLHIGDTSPPVRTERSVSPFDWKTKQAEQLEKSDSIWKTKQTEQADSGWKNKQSEQPDSGWKTKQSEQLEKSRARTGSFGSFSKLKPPESANPKSTLLSGGSGTAAGITNKKYSSSTSDLYSSTSGAYQISKPLGIEDVSSSSKTSVSNVGVTPSKLPRFQPYTGSGRRSSLTRDFEQFSAMGKDKFKTAPQTSFFNR